MNFCIGYCQLLNEFYDFLVMNRFYPSDFFIFETMMKLIKWKQQYQTSWKVNYYFVIKHILGEDRLIHFQEQFRIWIGIRKHQDINTAVVCAVVDVHGELADLVAKCGSYFNWIFINRFIIFQWFGVVNLV